MIAPNELRIGNWVTNNLCSPSMPWQVDLGVFDDKEFLDTATPILLTPEILNKCVAEKHFAGRFYIRIDEGGVVIGKRQEGVGGIRHIKYVHQLQNLYFSLVGEELKIDL